MSIVKEQYVLHCCDKTVQFFYSGILKTCQTSKYAARRFVLRGTTARRQQAGIKNMAFIPQWLFFNNCPSKKSRTKTEESTLRLYLKAQISSLARGQRLCWLTLTTRRKIIPHIQWSWWQLHWVPLRNTGMNMNRVSEARSINNFTGNCLSVVEINVTSQSGESVRGRRHRRRRGSS